MGNSHSTITSSHHVEGEHIVSATPENLASTSRPPRRRRAGVLGRFRIIKKSRGEMFELKKGESLRDTLRTEPPSHRFSSVQMSRVWSPRSSALPLDPALPFDSPEEEGPQPFETPPKNIPFETPENTPQATAVPLSYQLHKNQHEELGYLSFQCNRLEDALTEARQVNKPVFCVEALIPGDVDSGNEIFSHPLLIEAAESLFVTVRPEEKEYQLRRSGSGRPCCTTVAFLDEGGESLTPVLGSDGLTLAVVVTSMIKALENYYQSISIPTYLQLLKEEAEAKVNMDQTFKPGQRFRKALFGMKDSRMGEVELAGLVGVLTTRSGLVEGQRVVEAGYDSRRVRFCSVVAHALRHKVCDIIYVQTNDERVAAIMEVSRNPGQKTTVSKSLSPLGASYNPKSALRGTPMRFVPMTEVQATKVNRLIYLGKFNEAMHLLSPRQGLILMQAMRSVRAQSALYDVVEYTILSAWISVCTKESPKKREDSDDSSRSESSDDF